MKAIIDQITQSLQGVYEPHQARELAFWLMEELTGKSRFNILACKDTTFFPNLQIYLERLRQKEPIQYIFEHCLWSGLDLRVTPDTLIPRPETAELVDHVHRHFSSQSAPVRVLDIGTGSGCIAIALKQQHPDWQVTAVDISGQALDVARENAQRNKVAVDFRCEDILNPSPELLRMSFDVVVSNPPYVCESERGTIDSNVLDYEPATALFVPDGDPLCFYRQIASLRLAPVLWFEINERFGTPMQTMLAALGYDPVRLLNDSYGKPRFIVANV